MITVYTFTNDTALRAAKNLVIANDWDRNHTAMIDDNVIALRGDEERQEFFRTKLLENHDITVGWEYSHAAFGG